MEKEVGSTSGAVVAAAAGWANWAMGAVTAKFYKSPPAPAQQSSTQQQPSSSETKDKTPDRSLSDSMNKYRISDVGGSSSGVKPVGNDNSGWDDADDDGWGELNEKTDDDKNEGWDDNDDWGSLEESSGRTTAQKEPSTASYDWGGGFNQATKTHDAFADIKPSSNNSDNLMAGPGGWEDWGSPGAGDDKEEARRRREEKRAERQKELEAKRAAKKGPMKLGGKKMID